MARDKAALPTDANVVSSSMAKSSMPCRRAESPGLVLSEIVTLRGIENKHTSYYSEPFSLIGIILTITLLAVRMEILETISA